MTKYNHNFIEKKWQKFWRENKTYTAEIDLSKPKYYVLDMFPYPSGAGLHVGHVTGYTGTDILARHKRQLGFNVLHPMGWDSFGLPAEQYAIRTGTHPAETTAKNIETYRKQLESLGFSYDWDREITTSEPDYYKWTQWIFTKLYEKGLAYEAMVHVNFCSALGTVLANEEVENGLTKEGGYPVERKPLRQWVLKITEYADRLLNDLDLIDWPEHLKILQRNWIGRSEGATIYFHEKNTQEEISIFTTCPHTIFGVTYLTLAPEHPLIEKITTTENQQAVEAYKKQSSSKADLQRTDLAKEKTGVFTGAYALHPITKKEIPIWISDFVLMNYGTGAIMSVPAHDARDFDFAKKFSIPIQCVIAPQESQEDRKEILQGEKVWTENGTMIDSDYREFSINHLDCAEAKEKTLAYLEGHQLGKRTISYKLRDWLFSRQRYWGEPIPVLHFEDGTKRFLDLDELPLIPPEINNYKPSSTGESPLAKIKEWVQIKDPKTKKKALRETNTMPQWAGSCWYYLRFIDPKNSEEAWSLEAEKYWLPVDMYVGGSEHAVLHLLYARFWHKVLYDLKLVHTSEPFKTYRNQGLVTARSFKKLGGGYVSPDNVLQTSNGQYQTRDKEPLISHFEKMSKSKLNGITPDEIIQEYGADALRLYEMFMGPFDKEKLWNTDAVHGCKRFLNRFYDFATSDKIQNTENIEGLKLAHKLLSSVMEDIEQMQFNTAIAHMMEFLNAIQNLDSYPLEVVKIATQVLHPFAPHITEEIWQLLGYKTSISYIPLPKVNREYLQEKTTTYVLQINGKTRGSWELPIGQSKDSLLDFMKKQPQGERYLKGEVVKVIYIPDKLLNVVLK